MKCVNDFFMYTLSINLLLMAVRLPQLVGYLLKSMDEHTEEAKEVEEHTRLPVSVFRTR